MKRILVGLVLSASTIIPITAIAPAATADTLGCVTKAEFRQVVKGMSLTRVHNIFDTAGKQTYFSSASPYYPAEQWREYKSCTAPRWSMIEVDYKKRNGVWVVSSKLAYWG